MSVTGCGTGCGPFRRHPRMTVAHRCQGKRKLPAPRRARWPGPASHEWGRIWPRGWRGRGGPLATRCVRQRYRARRRLAEVYELQCEAEVVAFHQGDHGLQVVLLLRGHAQFLALHLGADALGSFVPDQLGDLPRVVLRDALLEADAEAELLAGRLWFARIEGLE